MYSANIIVRSKASGKIVQLIEVRNFEQRAVAETVKRAREKFGDSVVIDESQVNYARQACAA